MKKAQVIKELNALKEAFEEERDAYPICLEEAIRLLEPPDGGDMISRKAAIEVLEERLHANGYSNVALVSELNRSIGYLMRLPSVQPYTDEEIQAMQNLEQAQLDKAYELGWKEGREALRQEAIDAIEILLEQSEDDEHDKTWNNAIRGSINAVKHHVPSAQLEFIACGDCKHWICHDRRCGYWNHGVGAIDWCSHAERRINE